MSYICEDPRAKHHLKTWSGNNQLPVLKFFFWKAGSENQKSLLGFLRSIIHQLLERCPEIINNMINDTGISRREEKAIDVRKPLPNWTESTLKSLLRRIKDTWLGQQRLCLFVDGLDESRPEDIDDIIETVRSLTDNPRIKACISSRPDRIFENAFGRKTMLRLQDLTVEDIRKYVVDKLVASTYIEASITNNTKYQQGVVEKVISRAQGVFLWVTLAVKDLIHGINAFDSLHMLGERLELLPDDIEVLYFHMLSKIDKIHRKEAILCLQLALLTHSFGLQRLPVYAFLNYNGLQQFLRNPPSVPKSELIQHCRKFEGRLTEICAGVLECQDEKNLWVSPTDEITMLYRHIVNDGSAENTESSDEDTKTSDEDTKTLDEDTESADEDSDFSDGLEKIAESESEFESIVVNFHHRAAFDFLAKSPKARKFMADFVQPESQLVELFIQASLAEILL